MEHFTYDDYKNGLCDPSQVGSAKDEPINDAPIEGPSSDWLKAGFQGMGGKTAFVEFCRKNPALMWPLLVKNGLAQLLKEAEPLKRLGQLTPSELEALDSKTLKQMLLDSAKG